MPKKSTDKDKFLKKPHTIKGKIGALPYEAHLAVAENLPKTTAAMAKVAKAETRDDIQKSNGSDDYILSFEKLMHAFDAFIAEGKAGKKRDTGAPENYDFSDPCELTIFLLWQIRNVMTHSGGVIDEKCKRGYEKTLADAQEERVGPIIELPDELIAGHEFVIDFENYRKVKECVFTYIGGRIPEKDLKILRKRASISNIEIVKGVARISYDFGTLEFDIQEAHDCGFEIDPKTLEFPEGRYDPEKEMITVLSTRKSFPAKLVK